MTRQQIIDLIINAKRTAPETGSFVEHLADFLIGYGVMIAPTREQVERLRGEWQIVRKIAGGVVLKCSVCGAKTTFYVKPEKFCADCGSPMTDGAVEILMKRLEAMKK